MLLSFLSAVIAQQMLPVHVHSHWAGENEGLQGYLTIQADKPIKGWQARLVFDRPIKDLNVWEGQIISSKDNKEWIIGPVGYNKDITPGNELKVWFNAHGAEFAVGMYSIEPIGQSTTTSQAVVTTSTTPPTTTSQTIMTTPSGDSLMKYNYSEALGLSILFFDAQRSGKLPLDNPIPWRGDSALNDSDTSHDLSGGWYNGGDHVKFNFPMAYSTWVLEWGLLKFKDGYIAAGQLDQACDMIKWPLEYFLKCWIPDEDTLYVQVGEGHRDHSYWGRPENMQQDRKAFKVTSTCPGSDVVSATASALAAGYLLFSNICPVSDKLFASKLLTAAKSLYTFAMNNRRLYSDCVPAARDFYRSSGDSDDLSVAAAWLYKATAQVMYFNDARRLYPAGAPWAFSWDDVSSGAALLLYEETGNELYKYDIEAFVKSYLPKGSVIQTPCGLAWLDQWGPNRYAANAAFIALMAAEEGIHAANYKAWALSQINYLLGDNKQNMSYEIGFGKTYPRNPHHRGSSCPISTNICNIGDSGSNPNELIGALVGGPNVNDEYTDTRMNYVQNEVACDFNAGFQSALAGLRHFAHNNNLPRAPPSKC